MRSGAGAMVQQDADKMQVQYRYSRCTDKMLRCRGADMEVLSSEYQILRLSVGDCAGAEVQVQRCRC